MPGAIFRTEFNLQSVQDHFEVAFAKSSDRGVAVIALRDALGLEHFVKLPSTVNPGEGA
jgi:hypothetical protein